jgi:hypothetical protein
MTRWRYSSSARSARNKGEALTADTRSDRTSRSSGSSPPHGCPMNAARGGFRLFERRGGDVFDV